MKYYVFLTNNIRDLLESKLIDSNHLSSKWNLLLGQKSFVIFSTQESIEELSPVQVEPHIPLGQYLVELNSDVVNFKLDEIPYSSYISLSQDIESRAVDKVKTLYDRAKTVVKYSDLNAIFVTELNNSMIKHVYRYNSVKPFWVQCEIVDHKLIHKIQ